jgi:DNA-binding response OmpR family regulator
MLCLEAVKAAKRSSASARILLVLGNGMSESDGLLAGLEARDGFRLVRAANAELAEAVLRESAVSLALACPETPASEVERLVAAIERSGGGVPVLAIRQARSAETDRLAGLGIGILRSPLLPDALSRSVEVVLGLKRR